MKFCFLKKGAEREAPTLGKLILCGRLRQRCKALREPGDFAGSSLLAAQVGQGGARDLLPELIALGRVEVGANARLGGADSEGYGKRPAVLGPEQSGGVGTSRARSHWCGCAGPWCGHRALSRCHVGPGHRAERSGAGRWAGRQGSWWGWRTALQQGRCSQGASTSGPGAPRAGRE